MEPRFIREPFEVYQASRSQYMTSHQLLDYAGCPQRFKQRRAGLISEVTGDWWLIGAAAHCLICEGRQVFDARYLVSDGPINPKTDKPYGQDTKAYREWEREQARPVLRTDDYALLCHLEASVRSHAVASPLFRGGVAEAVLRGNYCGVPCQIRLDYWRERCIIDLKTCDDIDRFEQAIENFGYRHQMAFYHGVLYQQTHIVADVRLVAVEKKPPYRCGVWLLSPEALGLACYDNERALYDYQQSVLLDYWPTRYEKERTYTCPPSAKAA